MRTPESDGMTGVESCYLYMHYEWPESQDYLENEDCIPDNNNGVFVPLSVFEQTNQIFGSDYPFEEPVIYTRPRTALIITKSEDNTND